ncbi:MAG: eukaryotic-like serine/threonine-protein kinase [Gammaproteobacteria bacterium]|jgi:DNA-binding winged helix-turn-helix (wHTH) protein/serine/threonine protein kinase|nr:eukaryotic-like serine/threonine-protein kinase [Gammaproteobacteria bacterium]
MDNDGVTGDRPSSVPRPNADRGRRRWHFAGTIFDERTLELLVNGVDAELERKPLEVLIYLLEHAGEVCTKDEILTGVWPGRILSETVLTKCIGRLREVLGDREQDIIKTAYGFGYRFIAPVQVEVGPTPGPGRLDFKPGDHPPGRPLWSLVERLGIGGHGETWRARHEKTHEQRVFKFALDETSLGALKREITLFRIINDLLGDRARIVRLLDWNLEQLPYFTEAEYVAAGNLADWTKGLGGIAAIPVVERLGIVAKIAAALAAVHSVGVLHKDLKPSNIFLRPVPGEPVEIALGNFGSGGMLDAGHIDRLGITRLGFTKTVAAPSVNSAAPLYLAPEILNGQPFTVKSDIYALGVILYQFLAGDFHKVMSAEWPRDIDDELLREDIALVAHGNPAMRLADADILVQRLRNLDERRSHLIAQRQTQAKVEDTRHHLERTRAQRVGVALAFAALTIGLAVSTVMYVNGRRAQELSAAAAAQSKAVTEFLSSEVYAPEDPGVESAKAWTTPELLTRTGNKIDLRFAGQPAVASELHYIMGRSLNRLHEYSLSVLHLSRAVELGQQDGAGFDSALRSASELVEVDYALGNLRNTLPRYEAVLAAGERRKAPDDLPLLELEERVARARYLLGDWSPAAQDLGRLLKVQSTSTAPTEFLGEIEFDLGQVLTALARSADAEVHLRRAIEILTREIGATHPKVAEARTALGRSLADTGQFEGAAEQFDKAQEPAARSVPLETGIAMRTRYFRALLFLQMDAPEKAEFLLAQIVAFQDAHSAADLQTRTVSVPEVDRTGPVRQALGEAYAREGNIDAAIIALQRAAAIGERADGAQHPGTQSIRLSLAECLVARGRDAEARAVLTTPAMNLAALPAVHPIAAQLGRVNGLLAQHEGNVEQARKSFGDSLAILQALYGSQHWRVIRARQELQRAAS